MRGPRSAVGDDRRPAQLQEPRQMPMPTTPITSGAAGIAASSRIESGSRTKKPTKVTRLSYAIVAKTPVPNATSTPSENSLRVSSIAASRTCGSGWTRHSRRQAEPEPLGKPPRMRRSAPCGPSGTEARTSANTSRARRTELRVRYTSAVSASSRQPRARTVSMPSFTATTANGSAPTSRNAYQSESVAYVSPTSRFRRCASS